MKILAELAIMVATVILIVMLAALLVSPSHAALHPAALERATALVSVAWATPALEVPVPCGICWDRVTLVVTMYAAASVGAVGGFLLCALFASGGPR